MNTSLVRILTTMMLAAPAVALANTLIRDDFNMPPSWSISSSEATSPAGYTYSAITSGSAYFSGSTFSLNYNADAYGAAGVHFSPVTLAHAGDSLSFSVDVQGYTSFSTTGGSWRFGLYGSSGDFDTLRGYDASTNPVGNTGNGYFLSINPNPASGSESTASSIRRVEGTGTQTSTYNAVYTGTEVQSKFAGTFLPYGSWTTITLSVTRQANGSLQFDGSIAGVAFSVSDADPSTYTFDAFVFGNGASAGTNGYKLDNLNVSTIPEAKSSAALLSIGMGLLVVYRRRKSSRGRAASTHSASQREPAGRTRQC